MSARTNLQSKTLSDSGDLADQIRVLNSRLHTIIEHHADKPASALAFEWLAAQTLTPREMKLALLVARWTMGYGARWPATGGIARLQFARVLSLTKSGPMTNRTLESLQARLRERRILERIVVPGKATYWRLVLVDELLNQACASPCRFPTSCTACGDIGAVIMELNELTRYPRPRNETLQRDPLETRADILGPISSDPPAPGDAWSPASAEGRSPMGSLGSLQRDPLGHHVYGSLIKSLDTVTSPANAGQEGPSKEGGNEKRGWQAPPTHSPDDANQLARLNLSLPKDRQWPSSQLLRQLKASGFDRTKAKLLEGIDSPDQPAGPTAETSGSSR